MLILNLLKRNISEHVYGCVKSSFIFSEGYQYLVGQDCRPQSRAAVIAAEGGLNRSFG